MDPIFSIDPERLASLNPPYPRPHGIVACIPAPGVHYGEDNSLLFLDPILTNELRVTRKRRYLISDCCKSQVMSVSSVCYV